MVYLRFFLILFLAVGTVACSAPGTSSTDGGSASDRLVISELSSSVVGMSAYQVVDNYKSLWLRKRGQDSYNNPTPIKVYVDGMGSAQGTISALRNIPAEEVESIEYYNARRAQMQFGLDNSSGAILVNTKQGS